MNDLIRNRDYFQLLAKEFSHEEIDVLSDEPCFTIDRWNGEDYDYDIVDNESYLRDYCPNIGSYVNLFTNKIHVCYDPDNGEIELREMFHFNTSEYGVPSEYCKDEIHDSDACVIIIKKDTFWFNDEEYRMGSTEEERFQLSCTDLGYFIDIINEVKRFILEDIEDHGKPEV